MRLLDKKTLSIRGAASTDPTRYVLNGVLVEQTEKGVRCTATDGRTLAIIEQSGGPDAADFPKIPALESAKNGATSAIIPTAALEQAVRAIPKGKGLPILKHVALIMGDGEATLATTDLEKCNVIPTRVIEGQFPNVGQVVPTKAPVLQIAVDPVRLAAALKIAGEVQSAADMPAAVILSFYGKEDPLKIEAQDAEHKATLVVMPMKADADRFYKEPSEDAPPSGDPPAVPPVTPPAETMPGPDGEEWPVISSYSRAQAIDDGMLVDLSQSSEVKEAGIKFPFAVTRAVFTLLDPSDKKELMDAGQSLSGRLWDLLTIMKLEIKRGEATDRVNFAPLFLRAGEHVATPVELVAVVGPGDTADPVITVMFPDED